MQSTSQTAVRSAKLLMVTPNNNNKFYHMKDNTDGSFSVEYGRVGSRVSTATYSLSDWDKKYNEKVRKGYKDVSHLFAVNTPEKSWKSTGNVAVDTLLKNLMRFAKQSIKSNYLIGADQVTAAQLEEAQNVLQQIQVATNQALNIKELNALLLDLFSIIPRKMNKVQDFLFQPNQTVTEIAEMMQQEQELLDVMAAQVKINQKQEDSLQQSSDLLHLLGLTMQPVENKGDIKKIKGMMGNQKHVFKQAFEVCHLNHQARFDCHLASAKNHKTELLWHGSRNENWLSILENGLMLRPNAIISGKMFGHGIYFADKFQKSLNYTSFHGSYWAKGRENTAFLAIYQVHVGAQKVIRKHDASCYNLNAKNLQKNGFFGTKSYDSVFAKGGIDLLNNEYIVYQESQCTLKYLVEITAN